MNGRTVLLSVEETGWQRSPPLADASRKAESLECRTPLTFSSTDVCTDTVSPPPRKW